MIRRYSLVFAAALGLPSAALVTTPARWIEERARCLDAAEHQLAADLPTHLSRRQARAIAVQIVQTCRTTIPDGLFDLQERANIEGADRYEITRSLLRVANASSR